MATNTYVALATVTASGGSASQLVWNSIDQTYTDLVLVTNGSDASATSWWVEFNGDTGAHYSSTVLYGTGSGSGASGFGSKIYIGNVGTNPSTTISHIMNYANTTTYKSVISRSADASNIVTSYVGLWRGSTGSATQAITSLTVKTTGTISAGSTFTLYGIKAESSVAKATGGIITSDATYMYHTFTSTGAFVPSANLTADVLVVAGGGGGGASQGGGGGAGGLLYNSGVSLASGTSYTCTVGGGGANGGIGSIGTAGVNSNMTGGALALTAAVGGGGGGGGGANGTTGGSGGGGQGGYGGFAGASGTVGQGNAGGASANSGNYGGGGGGGAGSAGYAGTASIGGNGGAGYTSTNIALMATATGMGVNGYFAGGGGGGALGNAGGTGGTGGGGNGTYSGTATAGATNTGSGGGGGGGTYGGSGTQSGSGGSGIIIVRYLK